MEGNGGNDLVETKCGKKFTQLDLYIELCRKAGEIEGEMIDQSVNKLITCDDADAEDNAKVTLNFYVWFVSFMAAASYIWDDILSVGSCHVPWIAMR